MNDLRSKMEAELNNLARKKLALQHDIVLDAATRAEKISDIDLKQFKLRRLIQSYINIQNSFTELMNGFAVPY